MGEYKANTVVSNQVNELLFAQAPSRVGPPQPWVPVPRASSRAVSMNEPVALAMPELSPQLSGPHDAASASPGAALFPILDGAAESPRRTGLVRMADNSEVADEGHLVEFRTLAVRSILNKSVSKRRLWFARTINPYRGCEFACRYCYARYTHEFLELKDPAAFERQIFIKQNAAWLLEQELRTLDPEEEIAIGTATDPYQPIERRAQVTRSILEVLSRRSGHRIGIVTKSTLIERDIDLLQQIATKNELVLHITITTPDAALARQL